MPVKRNAQKGRRFIVTPEMVTLLNRLDEIKPIRRMHSETRCPGVAVLEHCPICHEAIDKSLALDAALGLRPWQTSPDDVDLGEPPEWISENALRLEDWRNAQELRRQIEAASKQ